MRYDVVFCNNNVDLVPHFCRDWDAEGGCYGTRKDHGASFEEGKQIIIEYHKQHINFWEELTEEDFQKASGYAEE